MLVFDGRFFEEVAGKECSFSGTKLDLNCDIQDDGDKIAVIISSNANIAANSEIKFTLKNFGFTGSSNGVFHVELYDQSASEKLFFFNQIIYIEEAYTA